MTRMTWCTMVSLAMLPIAALQSSSKMEDGLSSGDKGLLMDQCVYNTSIASSLYGGKCGSMTASDITFSSIHTSLPGATMSFSNSKSSQMEASNTATTVLEDIVSISTQSPIPSSSMTPAPMLWLYLAIGAAIALLILMLLSLTCCLFVIVARKIRKGKKCTSSDKEAFIQTDYPSPQHHLHQLRPQRISFVSKSHHVLSTHSHPLSIAELGRAVQDVFALQDEYMNVPSNMVTANEVPPGASDKNRYQDVLPNPHSRVALFLKFGIHNSDYINANYIRGFNGSAKAYIATQGPLPWTVADFWRMVWEQKSTVIIMVTGLEERGQVKCAQYWPDTARRVTSERYGDIEVTIQRRTSNPTYTLTNFQLKHIERQVVRDVVHYWYTAWPDHGVPDTSDKMLEFILASRQARDSASIPGPVVVHCSAGIGRTGMFIGADMGMRELERDNSVDVLRILASMRKDRGGMIQTKEQYVFLHKLLYDYARRISPRQGSSCLDSPDDTNLLSTPSIHDSVTCDP